MRGDDALAAAIQRDALAAAERRRWTEARLAELRGFLVDGLLYQPVGDVNGEILRLEHELEMLR